MMPATAAGELVAQVRISRVWAALGGCPLHGQRGQAFWRSGDGFNVALDEDRGVWCDHARGEGGGILDLIQHARGSSRQDALCWLADFAGVRLQDRPWNDGESGKHARRLAIAEREACAVVAWRDGLVGVLEESRDAAFRAYHRARRFVLRYGLDSPAGDAAADIADLYEARYKDLDRRWDLLRRAPWPALLEEYRRREGRAA